MKNKKMTNRVEPAPKDDPATRNELEGKRRYQKPVLVAYGDVRDITLAGSGGGGESGFPTSRFP